MTRLYTGYDAVPAGVPHLPADADFYMGYVDGEFISYPLIRRRFPAHRVIPISVWGGTEPIFPALILDVERGNPTAPARVPIWVRAQQLHGYKLSELGVYASLRDSVFGWPAIERALHAAGLTLGRNIAADWTGTPHLPAGFQACQYRNEPEFDVNCATAQWLGITAPPAPAPALVPSKPTPTPPPIVNGEQAVFDRGFQAGFHAGFQSGYKDGYHAGWAARR